MCQGCGRRRSRWRALDRRERGRQWNEVEPEAARPGTQKMRKI